MRKTDIGVTSRAPFFLLLHHFRKTKLRNQLTSGHSVKGGAVVIWRTDLYIAVARRQLSDTSSYCPLDLDPTPNHQNIIQTIHNLITLVQELPIYVHDTTHALHLHQLLQFPGPQHLIFTIDVQFLYTCIPHADGLKTLRFFLSRRPDQSPSTNTLIRLAELALTLNNFSVNSSHFLQTKGVATGTRMGPSYACLFVGYMEQSLFHS
eukprot:g45681.t1